MANSEAGSENKERELKLKEIKAKIAQSFEIRPEAKYLIVVKNSTIRKPEDIETFCALWKSAFNNPCVIFMVADPEKDFRLFESV